MDNNSVTFEYLCDQKACGDICSYPICRHTTDKHHAIHPSTALFTEVAPGRYREKEDTNAR